VIWVFNSMHALCSYTSLCYKVDETGCRIPYKLYLNPLFFDSVFGSIGPVWPAQPAPAPSDGPGPASAADGKPSPAHTPSN
jgi:hypothetical protein